MERDLLFVLLRKYRCGGLLLLRWAASLAFEDFDVAFLVVHQGWRGIILTGLTAADLVFRVLYSPFTFLYGSFFVAGPVGGTCPRARLLAGSASGSVEPRVLCLLLNEVGSFMQVGSEPLGSR